MLRVAAEFDNYCKRVANERLEWMQQAQTTLIESVLPVLDDLERIESANDEQKDYETLHDGILLILKSFRKILSDYGLVEMKTVGEPFDPEKHDALLQIETKDKEPDVVVEQHLKGYEFKDKVIRHAKVIVSK